MTKEDFAERWDSDDDGGGITFDDIAKCAEDWGLYERPKTHNINEVLKKVVEASGASDLVILEDESNE